MNEHIERIREALADVWLADPVSTADVTAEALASLTAIEEELEELKRERDVLQVKTREPRLGFATTRGLIDELQARAEVAQTVGEAWPSYRTVGETS